jgi:N-acetyl-anhydromuramyl-L-alanine amidase AmpD
MVKPLKMNLFLGALFAVDGSPKARWGSQSSHPVVKARVELEGTGLTATTNAYGSAQLDVSSLSSGNYVLALTPDAANLLRDSPEPVNASDGKTVDVHGTCRYRPLKLQLSLEVTNGEARVGAASTCDGATHGVAFAQPNGLLVDWKPDWVACKHSGPRPAKANPTHILLHRTGGPTPGSALDSFLPSPKSSHYLVDVDGYVIKLVHEDLVANHAGTSWWNGRNRVGEFSVGIEIVNQDGGGDFTPHQYQAVIRIIRNLMATYPDITRHHVIGHGEVRVRSDRNYLDYLKKPNSNKTPDHDLALDERPGCPGFHFDWTLLAAEGLCSKADPSLFAETQIYGEYGGYFKDNPFAKLSRPTTDAKVLRSDKTSYGVIASLQAELSALGYPINSADGVQPTGSYDDATQRAVDRFRRRYMPGVIHSHRELSPIFDRATAITLKRVILDRLR